MRTVPCCRRLILPLAICLLVALALSALAHAQTWVRVKEWGTRGSGDGQFDDPEGIDVDADGYVYVADTSNYRIQKFDSNGKFLRKWGSRGTEDDQFGWPEGVAVHPRFGTVYVADNGNNRIQVFSSSGSFLRKWGESGTDPGELSSPEDVAVSAGSQVYVVGYYPWVQAFSARGVEITRWGSQGSGDGQFWYGGKAVAIGPGGLVYVADYYLGRVQKFDRYGNYRTQWGDEGSSDEQFTRPTGLAVDTEGNVYVAESESDTIRKFTSEGKFLSKIPSWGSNYGIAYLRDVAVDAHGYVYALDRDNVLKLELRTPQPDMRARLPGGGTWRFDNVYGRAGMQTLAAGVPEGQTQVYELSLQNDAPFTGEYRVFGKAFGERWKIRYFYGLTGDNDITDKVTSAEGYRRIIYRGEESRFRAEITAPDPAEGDSRRSAVIRAVSQRYGTVTDAVKLVLRVRKHCQPDMGIRLAGEKSGSGNNIYNTTGAGQSRKCAVAKGNTATYWLGVQNDGNVKDRFRITAPFEYTRWRVRYFDALTDGTDITGAVTGAGWRTPELNAGKWQAMRVEVTPKRTAVAGDRAPIRVLATSTIKSTQKDAVKAITVVKSTASTSSCQVTSLSAIPTRAGAQITFTLSSAAQVEARVLSIAGRPVATICRERDCDAGTNTLLWDARSAQGLPVPNGTYLIEITAKAEEGAQARALTQVRLDR